MIFWFWSGKFGLFDPFCVGLWLQVWLLTSQSLIGLSTPGSAVIGLLTGRPVFYWSTDLGQGCDWLGWARPNLTENLRTFYLSLLSCWGGGGGGGGGGGQNSWFKYLAEWRRLKGLEWELRDLIPPSTIRTKLNGKFAKLLYSNW